MGSTGAVSSSPSNWGEPNLSAMNPAPSTSLGWGGGISAVSSGLQAGTAIGGAYSQSRALKSQGAYLAMVGAENSKLATVQGEDATRRGDLAASKQLTATSGLVGSQRAGYGGQGVDVNSGSAAEVQGDTQRLGALDALTIKNNAWREAWGYRQQAFQATTQGQFAQQAAQNEAGSTLLSGGMKAVSYGMQGADYAMGGGYDRRRGAL